MLRSLVIIAVLAIPAAAAPAQTIHKWVDAEGNVHFGDAPPPSAQSRQRVEVHDSSFGGGGLRPGERRMLERIEREEYMRSRERAWQRSQESLQGHLDDQRRARECERLGRIETFGDTRERASAVTRGRQLGCP